MSSDVAPYLTVGRLRELLSGLPDDTPVLTQQAPRDNDWINPGVHPTVEWVKPDDYGSWFETRDPDHSAARQAFCIYGR